MSTTDCHIDFDGRLWDIRRMLRAGDVEHARVESALLLADSQAACHDWVAESLDALWQPQEPAFAHDAGVQVPHGRRRPA